MSRHFSVTVAGAQNYVRYTFLADKSKRRAKKVRDFYRDGVLIRRFFDPLYHHQWVERPGTCPDPKNCQDHRPDGVTA